MWPPANRRALRPMPSATVPRVRRDTRGTGRNQAAGVITERPPRDSGDPGPHQAATFTCSPRLHAPSCSNQRPARKQATEHTASKNGPASAVRTRRPASTPASSRQENLMSVPDLLRDGHRPRVLSRRGGREPTHRRPLVRKSSAGKYSTVLDEPGFASNRPGLVRFPPNGAQGPRGSAPWQ